MRRILFALVLLVSVAGCEVGENFGPSAVKKEWPTVNLRPCCGRATGAVPRAKARASTPQ